MNSSSSGSFVRAAVGGLTLWGASIGLAILISAGAAFGALPKEVLDRGSGPWPVVVKGFVPVGPGQLAAGWIQHVARGRVRSIVPAHR